VLRGISVKEFLETMGLFAAATPFLYGNVTETLTRRLYAAE
jgi:hypothetical protein